MSVPPAAPGRQKLWIYAAGAATFFANGMFNQYFFRDREVTPLDILFGFVGLLLLFAWYRVDARQRQFKPPRGMGMAILLLAIVGMPVYLFKTRGFARGLLATVLFLAALLGSGAMALAGANATYFLFQQ